ncbi:glutamyl-tRNA reductase [Aminipila luticellarii]|uniref:Glutamyl-tRNA reductase n=1 Tax=Aminipila luticellarii TaxID=2507160 RepID=A0A410PU15_9FIRM|nr:glutamyl-tRNA reductase [Aminipila luticellarii]QAT42400.1 glutamyl-tRNA reductase [Aminipila luticellarii]
MRIRMVGIDHSKASLDYREAFSFTKAGVKEALGEMKKRFQLKGCILLSTCNRTELWISQCDNEKLNKISPYDMLCQIKKIDTSLYEEYFIERDNRQAIEHLLKLVCGFDSKIFGEDQIISQVREALQMAREEGCADMALEKVFQTALAAGKKVKTEVRLSMISRSSASNVIDILKSELGDLKGVPCLVIGNGQMGKLVVNMLVACGASVSMTLRRKMHGMDEQESIVPERCSMVSYDDRISQIKGKQVIVSATLSPHYTLRSEEVQEFFSVPCITGKAVSEGKNKYYLFDLAVPRDVDPAIAKMPYVNLFDIDSMNSGSSREENAEQVQLAINILTEYQEELDRWFEFRQYIPKIQEIVNLVSEDAEQRFIHTASEIEEDSENSVLAAEKAAGKATSKLLYGLREQLPQELWEQCLDALHRSASRETLKH